MSAYEEDNGCAGARLAAIEYEDAARPEVDEVLQQLVDDVRAIFGTDLALANLILPEMQCFKAWAGDLPPEFVEDAAAQLPSLSAALGEGDTERVEEISHLLKGSSGNMGTVRMAVICAQLQDAGTSRNLERAPELLDRLETEFERVRVALDSREVGCTVGEAGFGER